MAQITNGIKSILSNPYIYDFFQRLVGSNNGSLRFINDYVIPFACAKLIDIG